MTLASPTWFRRHRGAVLGSVAAAALIASALALASAVQRVRIAASRLADL
jgi:hypothetical protein